MSNSTWIGLLSLVTLGACAAPAASEESPATGTQDVVGITDLSTLEQSLDLTLATPANPSDTAALQAGACYRALIAEGTGYPTFEFRRYATGAAFWAKKGSGYNSGDQRPVLCVDLHRGDSAISLSGAALDAVLRYDLGRIVGQEGGMQKLHVVFERGAVHLSVYDVSDAERFDAVRKRPHEQSFENASTISGRLSSLTLNGVTADVLFDGVSVRDVEMSGDMAALIYRFAWRKGEDTGRFMLAEDAVGAFQRRASFAGDGGGYGETWTFARGEASVSRYADQLGEGPGRTTEEVSIRSSNAPPDRAPLADCTRATVESDAPSPYRCTGI